MLVGPDHRVDPLDPGIQKLRRAGRARCRPGWSCPGPAPGSSSAGGGCADRRGWPRPTRRCRPCRPTLGTPPDVPQPRIVTRTSRPPLARSALANSRKKLSVVAASSSADADALQLGDLGRGMGDEGRLVGLAALRHRRQVGRVGLDQQPVERDVAHVSRRLSAALKVTMPEIEMYMPSASARSRHLGARAEAMDQAREGALARIPPRGCRRSRRRRRGYGRSAAGRSGAPPRYGRGSSRPARRAGCARSRSRARSRRCRRPWDGARPRSGGRACAAPPPWPRADGRRPSTRHCRGARRWRAPCRTGRACVPMVSMPADAGGPGARQHAGLVARRARGSRDGSGCRSASARRCFGRLDEAREHALRRAAARCRTRAPSSNAANVRARPPARRAGRGSCAAESGMKGCTSERHAPDRLGQHPQHRVAPRRIGLGERPRRLGVDVAVGVGDHFPDRGQRAMEGLLVELARARSPAGPWRGRAAPCRPRSSAPLAGTLPPQFLATIDSTRWQRLP